MYKFSGRLFLLWTGLVAGIIVNIYFVEKMGIGNWPTEGKKNNNILHYCVHSEEYGRQVKSVE